MSEFFLSEFAPIHHVGQGPIPPGGTPLVEIPEQSREAEQLRRRRSIGERANALRRAGHYLPEDVRTILGWLDDRTFTMADVEMVLHKAEELFRQPFTVRPCLLKTTAS